MFCLGSKWHPVSVDCLELERSKQLTVSAFEVITPSSIPTFDASSPTTVIAKIARFKWEVPRTEQETIAYQLLDGSGLVPRFLAHIHENGRIMGFLLQKLEGRHASIHDLMQEDGIKLLDFENFQENASPGLMQKELENLSDQLVEESGRRGGFIPWKGSD
ncbi:conserved hypothetical protein [Verticillium alfalfae VaMs.102]|uniref:Uncharacterized protein n=1 Tax=Verticillium alfalfae (strain VaMs.102 / ATCC MYA-4576 / FGSC 10136) TaxID=526221 RepID=C9SHX8_VERA1|nr:conserved hypothetical protein [Verticillium alfalfae VaMs.102]EEY18551.1 conserved hypothetical protein [Verticillium alfalfae VaMs.102]